MRYKGFHFFAIISLETVQYVFYNRMVWTPCGIRVEYDVRLDVGQSVEENKSTKKCKGNPSQRQCNQAKSLKRKKTMERLKLEIPFLPNINEVGENKIPTMRA